MLEQQPVVAEPEPEEIRPVSAIPEKQNWFVPPADDELAADEDAHEADPEEPEADQYAVAPPTTADFPADESVPADLVPDPEALPPTTELLAEPEAYSHAPEPAAGNLGTHPATEPEAYPQAPEHTAEDLAPAAEPEADQPVDHPAEMPPADQPTVDHRTVDAETPQLAPDVAATDPENPQLETDVLATELEDPQLTTDLPAAESKAELLSADSADSEVVEAQGDQPADELAVEEPQAAPPTTDSETTPAWTDEPSAIDGEAVEVDTASAAEAVTDAEGYGAAKPEPEDFRPSVTEPERVEDVDAAFAASVEQEADESADVAESGEGEPEIDEVSPGVPDRVDEAVAAEPGDADESAARGEDSAESLEIELGPEWAPADDAEVEQAVEELLEVAEAPSAEFGVAEPEEDGDAVDVELLEPVAEDAVEEPADEIVDAELVDDSMPELVAAEPTEQTEEPAPETAAEPEPAETAVEPTEVEETAAEPAEVEETAAEPAATESAVAAAPSVVAVPRVPAVPIRQRGDTVGALDRRADPEQVLSAYPWVFDPATLRERIEEADPMGVVIDRLTDKLEYAERDTVRARLLSLRAVAERLLDELEPALEDAQAGLEHARRADDPVLLATVLGRLAHVRHWRGEYAEADRLYAEASSPELPTRLQAELHELAGRSAFEQGRYLEAVNHFETALDLRKGTDPDLVERIELALDTITGLTTEGWGPYPRTEAEILGGEPGERPGPVLFEDENGWGAVDADGLVVVEPKYDRFATALATGGVIDGFTVDGLAVVESDGRQGVIDRTGQVVLPLEHAEVRIHPAAFLVADKFGLWGALGRDGAPMVELTHADRADVIEEIERRLPATRPVL
ncbi:hypothetical protein [Actinoplanes sp. NPDC048796]|uniref:hypothetical protein n=1 Tax=Actinoplanes sp. NPDC048796 TaxID=3155640 RepID=UPI003402B26E